MNQNQKPNVELVSIKSMKESDFGENQFLKVVPFFLSTYSSENTRLAYANSIQEFFQFCEERQLPLSQFKDFQRFHLNAWQRTLETTSLSPASISAKLSALISFGRFLVENEWLEKNPGEFIRLPKISKQKGKTEALSEEEIKYLLQKLYEDMNQATLPHYKTDHHRAWLTYGIFITMATVGMRCSEFAHLKRCDLEKSGSYYRLRIRLKGGEDHSPLIPNYLSDFLLSYINKCRSFCGQEDPLFVIKINSNTPIRREVISEIISKVAKKYGIEKKISAHSLRATVASMLHKNKVPVGEIKDLLGHKSITTTMMYVRKTDEEQESAALKSPLNEFFNLKD